MDVWYNGGPSTTDGGWQFIPGGRVAEGTGYQGIQVKFGRLTTTGRADYLGINALTGGMAMWQNACQPGDVLGTKKGSGSSTGDATCSAPPLPAETRLDPNAPIIIIPPPVGGEPIPAPGEGNTATPPSPTEATTTSQSPTETSTTSPTTTSEPDIVPCDLDTTRGYCANGNYPVYEPDTQTINCDLTEDEAIPQLDECAAFTIASGDSIVEWIENEKACCDQENSKREVSSGLMGIFKRGLANLGLVELEKRVPHGYCPNPANDPHNQPANGPNGEEQCYATWTCLDNRWPNVCGNARSAIDIRDKTKRLTWHTTVEGETAKHDTAPM